MFIMTNVNIANDMIQVFDTSDRTTDVVRLSILSRQITSGKLKVYGLGSLAKVRRQDSIPIDLYGIYVCVQDAKDAMVKFYQRNGYTKEQAIQMVG